MDHEAAEESGSRRTRNKSSAETSRLVRIGRRLGSAVGVSFVPFFIVAFLAASVLNIGPTWSAKFGHGTRGTFTAERCFSTKSGCIWAGTFVSDDGRLQRADVDFPDAEISHVGQQVPARNTRSWAIVYPVDGGSDWLVYTALLMLSLAALGLWIFIVPMRGLEKRRERLAQDRRPA